MRIKLTMMGFLSIFVLTFSYFSGSVFAMNDAKAFNPANIIDDATFYDGDALSTTQIQSFLDAKVSTCDTNGTKLYTGSSAATDYNGDGKIQRWERGKTAGSPAPYTCLKDYRQNTPEMNAESGICGYMLAKTNRTAAEIISYVAAVCHVSPKVLIVLLQKEQGLVTDEWPWPVQYKKATGFSCPDTSPCDPAYSGYFYQVYYAAYKFRVYRANPNSYNYVAFQNNYIYYNPGPYDNAHNRYYGSAGNPAGSKPDITYCGGKTVYIRNQATAGLYNYTPYVPNSATLAVGLGVTAPPCGAYGNKNFWWYFTDWFGTTHSGADHQFIQCDDGRYLVESNLDRRRLVTAAAETAWQLTDSDFVDNEFGCTLPSYDLDLTNLVRSRNTGNVYLIDNANAYLVKNQDEATAWRLGSLNQAVPQVEPGVINDHLIITRDLPRIATSSNQDRLDIYLVDNGNRHTIAGTPSGETSSLQLIKGYDAIPTATMSVALLQTLAPAGEIDYSFAVGSDLYLLDHNVIRKASSASKALWQTATANSTSLSTQVLSLFAEKKSISIGFERDGYYYRLNPSSILDRTLDLSIANNWEPAGSPHITNLLKTKILSATSPGELLSAISYDNNIRLIECGGNNYIVERYIRMKRAITNQAIDAWGFGDKYFFVNDRGCSYPAYSVDLERAIRSRNTGKVYDVSEQSATYVSSQEAADSRGVGDISQNIYPQFNPKSITDNLTIIR